MTPCGSAHCNEGAYGGSFLGAQNAPEGVNSWRSVPLQPELFVELSPEHAREIGAINLETVQIVTPRAAIRAKRAVTPRTRPFLIGGKVVHHVGMSWHWGYKGISKGDVVNDLSALVGNPNVTIHEAKLFVCRVENLAAAGKSG